MHETAAEQKESRSPETPADMVILFILMNHPDCVQDDKLIRVMKSYYRAFGDTFPSYPNPPENAVEIIRDCLQKKKDVYELGYLSLDDNIIY